MGRKHKQPAPSKADAEAAVLRAAGLNPIVWEVDTQFTKGVLTGQRGVVVLVRNLKTGRSLKRSLPAGTKREARELRLRLLTEVANKLAGR